MPTAATITHKIICHCLQISEAEIRSSLASGLALDVKDVMDQTGAGTGCTACHCEIRELLGGQCPSSSSPTCVTR